MKKLFSVLLLLSILASLIACVGGKNNDSTEVINSQHTHSYSDATCSTPQTCTVCGATKGETLAHNYVAGECTVCSDFSSTYCPKLYFTGDMSEITLESQRNKDIVCNIGVEYRSKEQIVNRSAKIKIQGSSSTQWRKKNYTITF